MDENTEISLFESYFNPVPKANIPFWGFCASVMNEEYKKEIDLIRAESDKSKRDEIKSTLPAVTISGVFTERKKACLVKHSGLIALDFDSKENPGVESFRDVVNALSNIENVCFAALSASGRGAFAVIPLAFPERHIEHFRALQNDFAHLGLIVDKACSDVGRLRGITSDSEAYYNPGADTYYRMSVPRHRAAVKPTRGKAAKLIKRIIDKGVDITNEYAAWYQVGAALVSEFGEGGRDYFHELSKFYKYYDVRECDRQFDNCLKNPGGYTAATLIHYAKLSGIEV